MTICGNNGYAPRRSTATTNGCRHRSLRRALQKAHGDADVVVAGSPRSRTGGWRPCQQACAVPVVPGPRPRTPDVRGSPVGGVSLTPWLVNLFAATLRN